MGPKHEKTMLLVACAVAARTAFVACDEKSGCMGFYASDATSSSDSQPPEDAPQGCIGFYACDAYANGCQTFDAGDADATDDASDADGDGDAHADGADE